MKALVRFFPLIFLLMLGHSYLYAHTNLNGTVLTIQSGHSNQGTSIHLKATEIEEDNEENEKTNLPRKYVNADDYFGIFFNNTTRHYCQADSNFPYDNYKYNSSLPKYIRHRVIRI